MIPTALSHVRENGTFVADFEEVKSTKIVVFDWYDISQQKY